ncbi:MAG: hypothetical protein JNM09_01535 [Blastocatellia bacterium]|nr:hypothetical protein [Blastocatellia bacterium]
MKERTTQILLVLVAILLAAHLVRPALISSSAQASQNENPPAVLRAQSIELVDKQGQARAQLFLGEDGGGNLRLRDGSGTVRVKLGATPTGAGLILFDQDVEPAIWASTDKSSTSLKLAEKGKEQRVIKP